MNGSPPVNRPAKKRIVYMFMHDCHFDIPQPASACTGYPVTQYNLNIGSSDLNLTAMMLGPYTSNGASRVEIALNSSDGIHQNTHYHFQILAVNIIGSSISRGMEFCKT